MGKDFDLCDKSDCELANSCLRFTLYINKERRGYVAKSCIAHALYKPNQ